MAQNTSKLPSSAERIRSINKNRSAKGKPTLALTRRKVRYVVEDQEKKPLTMRQALFVRGMIEHGDAKKAAADAGYNQPRVPSPRRLLGIAPNVRAHIENAQNKMLEKAMVTREWKLAKLKHVADTSMPDNLDLIADDDFKRKLVQPTTCITAIAEMNKMQGDYAPDKTITGTVAGDLAGMKELLEECKREY